MRACFRLLAGCCIFEPEGGAPGQSTLDSTEQTTGERGLVMGNIDLRDLAVWAIMGLVAGAIADLFVPGSGGLIGYLFAGVVGSIVGGFLARRFNIKLNLGSVFVEQMVISVIGAIIVLVIVRIIF